MKDHKWDIKDTFILIFAIFICFSSSTTLYTVVCNHKATKECDIDFFRKWGKGFWGCIVAWATLSMLVSLLDMMSVFKDAFYIETFHKWYLGYPVVIESKIRGGIWGLVFFALSITIMVYGVKVLRALRKKPPSNYTTTLVLNIIMLLYSIFLLYILFRKIYTPLA